MLFLNDYLIIKGYNLSKPAWNYMKKLIAPS